MKYRIINKKFLTYLIVAVFWLIVWQIGYLISNNDNLVSSPLNTIMCFFNFLKTYDFWKTIILSILRIFLGFIFSIIIGIILAILTAKFKTFYLFFNPIMSVIKATPVVSLIILITAFMNVVIIPSFISFFMVLPIIWSNIHQGIITTDTRLLDMAKVFKIKKINVVRKIYIANVIPYFISSVSAGVGFAWKSGISAEVLVKATESIGVKISSAKAHMQITELFTWTVVIIILCFAFEKITLLIMKKLFNIKISR